MSGHREKPGVFYRQRADYERRLLVDAIGTHPTHTAAAKALGLTRTYMLRLMRELGVAGRTR